MSDLTRYGKDETQGSKIETEGRFNCKITSAKRLEEDEEKVLVCFTELGTGNFIFSRYQDNDAYGYHLLRLAQASGLSPEQCARFTPDMLIGKLVTIETKMSGQYCNVKSTHRYSAPACVPDLPRPNDNEDVPF